MTPAEQRKARRKAQNIQDIQEACFKLLMSKSVSELSMEDIAKEAGFGKGTLYNHFKNKDDLITSLLFVASNNFIENANLIANGTGTFKQKLLEIITRLDHAHTKDQSLISLVQHVQSTLRAQEPLEEKKELEVGRLIISWLSEFFSKGIENGEIPKNDPQRLASLVIHIFPELELQEKLGLIHSGDNVQFILNLITGSGDHHEN